MTTDPRAPKTSLSHPLQIAEVSAGPGYGLIGVTFCPGKTQASAFSGLWARDLDLDLDRIRDWGASAIVSLIEPHEFSALKVERLGEAVLERHMDWFHLPIRDVDVPDAAFEHAWTRAGADLRARLRQGSSIVVHCKGGLGRAGTIAARLLVELGMGPEAAIAALRRARSPGAIETRHQEAHVRGLRAVEGDAPSRSPEAVRDRAAGALLGLAIGDALGATLEFKARDSYPRLRDMVGGGPFRLQPGQWTDDTAMALALADSLIARGGLNEADLMERFVQWRDEGRYSCTGTCFDIGITTNRALQRWRRTGDPVAGDPDPQTAGNGSLMRLAPVVLRYWDDRTALADAAARQSRTTHAAPEAVEACVAYADLLADVVAGVPLHEALRGWARGATGVIAQIMEGRWRRLQRAKVRASGYAAHSLEAALWSVGRTGSYETAVLCAANLGEDADTTAAIAGQLAGAAYGLSSLPRAWTDRVAWGERILGMAERLLARP